jgi:hypothetical protein
MGFLGDFTSTTDHNKSQKQAAGREINMLFHFLMIHLLETLLA